EVVYNADWLSKLTFTEVAKLADSFTVAQMTNRRNFKDRLEKGDEVSLREFLYPLMQGYDSVVTEADVEIGGFDQLFNLKAGRTVQKFYNKPVQDVITTVMLEGTDGRKMSTSWGNVINITDDPKDMFGKIMTLNDELIPKYFMACTDISLEEHQKVVDDLKDEKNNPKDIKMRLAKEIVSIYHGKKEADKAEDNFIKIFSEGLKPDEIKEIKTKKGSKLVSVLVDNNIIESNSEFRRLVTGGAVKNVDTDIKIEDTNYLIESSVTLKIGKRRFLKIEVEA
ncbi:MAG: tyrosyl-tRNA synthetase, partial [Candidatus Paceibacteria bacterium]